MKHNRVNENEFSEIKGFDKISFSKTNSVAELDTVQKKLKINPKAADEEIKNQCKQCELFHLKEHLIIELPCVSKCFSKQIRMSEETGLSLDSVKNMFIDKDKPCVQTGENNIKSSSKAKNLFKKPDVYFKNNSKSFSLAPDDFIDTDDKMQLEGPKKEALFKQKGYEPNGPPLEEIHSTKFFINDQSRPKIEHDTDIAQYFSKIKGEDNFVTDEVVHQFQKMIKVLNYSINKADDNFVACSLLKKILEYYFLTYNEGLTTKLHNMTKFNFEFILNTSKLFNKDDVVQIDIKSKAPVQQIDPETIEKMVEKMKLKEELGLESIRSLKSFDKQLPKEMIEVNDFLKIKNSDLDGGKEVSNALLDAKLTIFNEKVSKISEVCLNYLYGKIDLSDENTQFHELVSLTKTCNHILSMSKLVRKFSVSFLKNFEQCQTLQDVKLILSDTSQMFQSVVKSHAIPDPEKFDFPDKLNLRSISIEFCQLVTGILIEEMIYYGKVYGQKFSELASTINEEIQSKMDSSNLQNSFQNFNSKGVMSLKVSQISKIEEFFE